MANNLRSIGMGKLLVSTDPNDILVAYGLGSCIAVCLYDPTVRVGGMIHALLPKAPNGSGPNDNPAKYVDRGVCALIAEMKQAGAKLNNMAITLCGGAHVLFIPDDDSLNIGERNIQAAEAILQDNGLSIHARATGGASGRTVRLVVASGQVTTKRLGQTEQLLPSNVEQYVSSREG